MKAAILFLRLKGSGGAPDAAVADAHCHSSTDLPLFSGEAARFTSAPPSLRYSYSFPSSWSTCIVSFTAKDTSFPLQDPHRSLMWSAGGERVTWLPVHPHRSQLMSSGPVCPHSFPLYNQLHCLAASPEVFKLQHQKRKTTALRKLAGQPPQLQRANSGNKPLSVCLWVRADAPD